MTHANINGIPFPGVADDLEETPEWVGDALERGLNGSMFESRSGRARGWSFRSRPMTAVKGEAWRRLIEGEGQAWRFDTSVYSNLGIGPSSSTGCTQSGSGGKYAGKLAITAGNRFEVDLAKRMARRGGWVPTMGWSILVWKKLTVGDGGDGVSYINHIATGAVAVTRGAAANPVGVSQYRSGVAAPTAAMGNWISLSAAGLVAIHAYSNADAATAYDWSNLVVLPFELPADWIAPLYAFLETQPYSQLGRVLLSGDCVEDADAVEVVGRVRSLKQRNVTLEGAHRNNARELEVELSEW